MFRLEGTAHEKGREGKTVPSIAALTGLDEELLQSENIKHYEETVAVGIEDEVDYGVDLNEILRRKGEII